MIANWLSRWNSWKIIIPAALGSSQILASDATRDAILPYIKVFASLAR